MELGVLLKISISLLLFIGFSVPSFSDIGGLSYSYCNDKEICYLLIAEKASGSILSDSFLMDNATLQVYKSRDLQEERKLEKVFVKNTHKILFINDQEVVDMDEIE